MCSCGFEFGYDDSQLATRDAVVGIAANWKRYRAHVIAKAAESPNELRKLEENLRNIGRRLVFDLIDVSIETNGEQGVAPNP